MTTLSIQKKLSKARAGISKESYSIQKAVRFDDVHNELLDELIKLKEWFKGRSSSILIIVNSLENLTWLVENPSEEVLQEINAILDLSRGVYSNLYKIKCKLVEAKIEDICPEALQTFFDDIDLLEETIDDLDAIYFRLPHNQEFNDICHKFSELE